MAQSAQVVTWADLQPKQTVDFTATFGHLSREQLQDLATLARIRWWLEDGQIGPESSDAQTGERLARKLTQQGLDVETLVRQVNRVHDQANDPSSIVGQQIRISGYVLPLEQTEPGRVSQLLLVPFVGACIHVPPPPPNQIIYIEPPAPIEAPGLFAPVWVEGQIRQQSASYDLFRVDGSRQVQASYAMSLVSITLDSAQSAVSQPLVSMPQLLREYPGWQAVQVGVVALFSQTMGNIQRGDSPSALWLGVLIAFGYGVIHTLGPGHGKVVITSYFVGNGGNLWRGISMGTRIACFHVMSAIGVVVLADWVMRQTMGSTPADYRLVRLMSYGAIALIGGWMLRQALRSNHQKSTFMQSPDPKLLMAGSLSDRILTTQPSVPSHRQLSNCQCFSCASHPGTMGWLSLAVGAVPCSGALLMMLYGLANNMVGPAVLMVLAISLGMGVTLSLIGLTALWGRDYMSRRIGKTPRYRDRLLRALNIAGASGVLLVGLLLFIITLNGGRVPSSGG
ncbi:MAG: DUF3299 domain-containing protein [Synechococcales bacterium]|nr:DUF3299 domain-containing protein [Synechococcales bacterium]